MESGIMAETVNFGLRIDGTKKGPGFLGALKRPDGRVSTELSAGVNWGEGERLIPLLTPNLAPEEINLLLEGNKPTKQIINKAIFHAIGRKRRGFGFFKEEGE